MKFRKKPVVIEAIQYTSDDISPMLNAWGPSFGRAVIEQVAESYLVIHTLEGNHFASFGDWIIKGIAGEFYPCKNEIFQKTYEAVSETKEGV